MSHRKKYGKSGVCAYAYVRACERTEKHVQRGQSVHVLSTLHDGNRAGRQTLRAVGVFQASMSLEVTQYGRVHCSMHL